MRKLHTTTVKGLALSASAIALVSAGQAYAQDAGDACVTASNVSGIVNDDGNCVATSDEPSGVTSDGGNVVIVEDASGNIADPGAIVVTGSRIKRDTYTSISPLQVLTSEAANEVGMFDPAADFAALRKCLWSTD